MPMDVHHRVPDGDQFHPVRLVGLSAHRVHRDAHRLHPVSHFQQAVERVEMESQQMDLCGDDSVMGNASGAPTL